jgi:WD40 repeat protein
MTPEFIQAGPGQKLLPTIIEADQSDNLIIGGGKDMIYWSVSQEKLNKHFGGVISSVIDAMV